MTLGGREEIGGPASDVPSRSKAASVVVQPIRDTRCGAMGGRFHSRQSRSAAVAVTVADAARVPSSVGRARIAGASTLAPDTGSTPAIRPPVRCQE